MVGLLGSILSQESSVKSGDAADQQLLDSGQDSDQKGFADAYTKNIDTLSAAKSGKHIPDSPEPSRNVAQHNGLTSKTLRGGMQIIIGGNEPTPEGLDQYAESQGIDEELLSLLMTGPQSAPILGNQVVANKPSAINRELEIDALISKHMTDVGAPLHNSLSPVALDALKADIDTLIVKHAERFTQSEGVKTPSSQPPAALNALKADIDTLMVKHAERTQSEGVKTPSSQPPAALNALKADIDTLMVKHADQSIKDSGANRSPQQPMVIAAITAFKDDIEALVLKRHSLNNDMAANSDKTVFSKQGLASSDSFDTQLNQKSSFQPVVSGATFRGGAGLYFSGQQLNSEVRPMKGEDLNKAIEPLNSKQTIKLAQHSVDRIKLPSINLSRSVGEVTAGLADSWIPQARLTKVVAAGESGSAVLSQTFVNNVNDLNTQPQARPDDAQLNGREHLQRQEQYLDISRRLSEALGQRLSSQIQRGAWQVELDLHPKSMGRIEVYLEMKNGELDAVFNASKSIARELLQDSIPRLRAELDQHGIATSFLGLSDGNSKGAGDQTMAQNGHNSDGEKALPTDEKLTASEPHRSKLSDDGLDIIV
jgi:flagellar hook-length control protein FliK